MTNKTLVSVAEIGDQVEILSHQLSEAQKRVKDLEKAIDCGSHAGSKHAAKALMQLHKKNVDLQHLCDDQADKLRRIKEQIPFNKPNSDWGLGYNQGLKEAKIIASSPLGPDWRGMCEIQVLIIKAIWNERNNVFGDETNDILESAIEAYEGAVK